MEQYSNNHPTPRLTPHKRFVPYSIQPNSLTSYRDVKHLRGFKGKGKDNGAKRDDGY